MVLAPPGRAPSRMTVLVIVCLERPLQRQRRFAFVTRGAADNALPFDRVTSGGAVLVTVSPGGSRRRLSGFAPSAKDARLARFANRPGASEHGCPRGSRAWTVGVNGCRGSLLQYRHLLTRQANGRVLPSTAACGSRRSAAFAKAVEACFHRSGVWLVRPVVSRVLPSTAALVVAPLGQPGSRQEVRLHCQDAGSRAPLPGKVLPRTAVLVIALPDGRCDRSWRLASAVVTPRRCTSPGKVPPSTAALVVAPLELPARQAVGACSRDRLHGQTAPSHRQSASALGSPRGCRVRRSALPAAEVRLRRPGAGLAKPCHGRVIPGEVALVAATLGRPVSTVVEVRLCNWTHVVEHSAPRAAAPFRRVRFPAKPGLVLGCVGRVEGARQREIPSAATQSRSASDRADGCHLVHAPPGLRTSRASACGAGRHDAHRAGGLLPASRAKSLRQALRKGECLRPGPASGAGEPCARQRWTGLCPPRKGLAPSEGERCSEVPGLRRSRVVCSPDVVVAGHGLSGLSKAAR
jgi:hypothetical protein